MWCFSTVQIGGVLNHVVTQSRILHHECIASGLVAAQVTRDQSFFRFGHETGKNLNVDFGSVQVPKGPIAWQVAG